MGRAEFRRDLGGKDKRHTMDGAAVERSNSLMDKPYLKRSNMDKPYIQRIDKDKPYVDDDKPYVKTD